MDNAVPPANDADSITPHTPPGSQQVDLTGQVLGEFRLLHRLGRGGMGQVYLAEQIALKRKVALKLLHDELASNERSLLRFKTEAENVARATHANIVQIYTIGQTNGVNYIALEYVDGKNLREFIEKKGTPEISLGLHIMVQVAAALQRAGELGVIHRDVKPENIMLTKKGEVKVADFGLSRCFEESNQQHLTQSQVIMGTPLYMSPEQVERKPVDSRTDIYSFGVTCYHMFSGNPPFKGNSPIDVAYQHVHQEPLPLGEIRPDLPAELCRIIHKMMAKKPEDRHQAAREIVRDLTRLRDSLNLGAIAAISMSASFLGSAPDPTSNTTQNWEEPPRRLRYWLPVAVVASVLAALGGSLLAGWYQHRTSAPKEPQNVQVVPEEPAPIKINSREREKELQALVQEHLQPQNQLDASAGLKLSVDLALLYLKEKKYDEANRFFKELRDPERTIAAYRLLGRIGKAVVLAYKDDYAASNKEFVAVLGEIEKLERLASGTFKTERPAAKKDFAAMKENLEGYKQLWKETWKVREMVARALHHNQANAPKAFPVDKLGIYLDPPRGTLRPAAAMP